MLTLVRTLQFSKWLEALGDHRGKAKVFVRLRNAALGHFGDCGAVGEGVSEMRIDFGPGYRIYFVRSGPNIYVLLAGGDKSSQTRDIVLAKKLAREIEEARQ